MPLTIGAIHIVRSRQVYDNHVRIHRHPYSYMHAQFHSTCIFLFQLYFLNTYLLLVISLNAAIKVFDRS